MKDFFSRPKLNLSFIIVLAGLVVSYSGCNTSVAINPLEAGLKTSPAVTASLPAFTNLPDAKASEILNRPQVPILCYHQIRNWTASDSKRAEDYIVPVDNFREQMKWLAENGYHTILPDQLYDYLLKGAPLPAKPVMLTYDDTREEQFSIAHQEMSKYGFKGVFFIMTVSLNRPGYMTRDEVKQLADNGEVIGSHTWDHSNVKNYQAQDWIKQVDKPSKDLEKITGKPVNYFAYPFGLWNRNAVEQIKERGFKAAFQLSDKRQEDEPQYTIRRMIVPGSWSTNTLQKWIKQCF